MEMWRRHENMAEWRSVSAAKEESVIGLKLSKAARISCGRRLACEMAGKMASAISE